MKRSRTIHFSEIAEDIFLRVKESSDSKKIEFCFESDTPISQEERIGLVYMYLNKYLHKELLDKSFQLRRF